MRIRCIQRIRDKNDKITGYVLQREDGVQNTFDATKMKQLLSAGTIVENLKLTSDNRILYMEKVNVVPESYNKAFRVFIDSNVLDDLVDNGSIVPVCAVQKQDNNLKNVAIVKAKYAAVMDYLSKIPLADILTWTGMRKTQFNGENKIVGSTDASTISLRDFMIMADKYSESKQSANSDISKSDFISSLGLKPTNSKKVYLSKETFDCVRSDLESIFTSEFPGLDLDRGYDAKYIIKFRSNVQSDIINQAKSNGTLIGAYQNGEIAAIKVGVTVVLVSIHELRLPDNSDYLLVYGWGTPVRMIDCNCLDTSNVKSMHGTFTSSSFNGLKLICDFNTSSVTNMSEMFFNVIGGDLDISRLDTRNVTDMNSMFNQCFLDSLELGTIDTRNVRNMSEMFFGANFPAGRHTLDLSGIDTRNVETMTSMFEGCNVNEIDISGFDTRSVKKSDNMFKDCNAKVIRIGSKWNLPNSVFEGCNAKIIKG